jgi:hypothetical protein
MGVCELRACRPRLALHHGHAARGCRARRDGGAGREQRRWRRRWVRRGGGRAGAAVRAGDDVLRGRVRRRGARVPAAAAVGECPGGPQGRASCCDNRADAAGHGVPIASSSDCCAAAERERRPHQSIQAHAGAAAADADADADADAASPDAHPAAHACRADADCAAAYDAGRVLRRGYPRVCALARAVGRVAAARRALGGGRGAVQDDPEQPQHCAVQGAGRGLHARGGAAGAHLHRRRVGAYGALGREPLPAARVLPPLQRQRQRHGRAPRDYADAREERADAGALEYARVCRRAAHVPEPRVLRGGAGGEHVL